MAAQCYDPSYYGGLNQLAQPADPYQRDLERIYEKMSCSTYTNKCYGTTSGCPTRKEPMNMKLIAKKMLNPDLRTLIKAGVLNNDLSVANPSFILEFYVNKHLKELAAEAKERMKELKVERDEE